MQTILFVAYLELLLLRYYGDSEDEDETPTEQRKLDSRCPAKHKVHLSIVTPVNPAERGCQLSVKFSVTIKSVHEQLEKRGVVVSGMRGRGGGGKGGGVRRGKERTGSLT